MFQCVMCAWGSLNGQDSISGMRGQVSSWAGSDRRLRLVGGIFALGTTLKGNFHRGIVDLWLLWGFLDTFFLTGR